MNDANKFLPKRDVIAILLKKSKNLLSDLKENTRRQMQKLGSQCVISTAPANDTPRIPSGSVQLTVTSPPFLDVVNYALDNWLRCWFIGIDAKTISITVPGKLEEWRTAMTSVFRELHRVTKKGGLHCL